MIRWLIALALLLSACGTGGESLGVASSSLVEHVGPFTPPPAVAREPFGLASIPLFPGALPNTQVTWGLVTSGDSRTSTSTIDWPHLLQRHLGAAQTALRDVAISGQTAEALSANFSVSDAPAIQAKQPCVYTLMIGVNDLKGTASPLETWGHVKSILAHARSLHVARIVLLGELPSSLVDDAKYQTYLALERNEWPAVADVFVEPDPTIVPGSVYSEDGTHPSVDGYARMAAYLYPVIGAEAYALLNDGGAP